ncbi:MAG: endonuclease domain-containing protein [Rhizomicrobium sp.]
MREFESKSRGQAKRLRREMPKAEVVLWKKLREANRIGYNFRHQHPIGPFIADFASLDGRLIIELDGASHSLPGVADYDEKRTQYLETKGYRVLRFRNEEIYSDLYRIVDSILKGLPPPSRRR